MYYLSLVTKYDFVSFVTLSPSKSILKAKSAVSRLVRMCLAQPGYGSGMLSPIYYRQNECSIEFYFSGTFT